MTDRDFEIDQEDLFSHLEGSAPRSTETPAQPSSSSDEMRPMGGKIFKKTSPKGTPYYSGSASSGVTGPKTLQSVSQVHSLFWVVNAKAAGIPNSNMLFTPETDFLGSMSEEVKGDNSIHLFPYGDPQFHQLLPLLFAKDCATCVGPEINPEDFAVAFAPLSAWFINAKALVFQIDGQSELLNTQIFSVAKLLFFQDMTTGEWQMFTHAKSTLSWQEIGLPVCPVSN